MSDRVGSLSEGPSVIGQMAAGVRDDAESGAFAASPRQREIVLHISLGLSDREIAAELNIKQRTVRTHIERLFARCNVRNRAALIAVWSSAARHHPN